MVLLQGSRLEEKTAQSSKDAKMMTVVGLARQVGVTPDTVRHYLRLGLLRPQRHPDNHYRLFTQDDAACLCFIHNARTLGFTLKEIAEILAASEQRNNPCPGVHRLLTSGALRSQAELKRLKHLQGILDAALLAWERLPSTSPTGRDVQALIESIGRERTH